MIPSCTEVHIARQCHLAIVDHAERCFPEECCGLLVGGETDNIVWANDIHESENLADDPIRRFEVDPALCLRLQRSLRGSGCAIIGIYHSHPTGPPYPSPCDLESAWEPDLVWLIMSVQSGRVEESKVHVLTGDEDNLTFLEVPLLIREMAR